MNSPTSIAIQDYQKNSNALADFHKFVAKQNYFSESDYRTEYNSLTNQPEHLLSSYSSESRDNSLFLANYFSIWRHPKNYVHVGSNALNDPYFLSSILQNKENIDLVLLFNPKLLDETYEENIWNQFNPVNNPTLKYCINEHYLKDSSKTEEDIQNLLITMVYKNQENLEYVPEKYLKDDDFFKKIIFSDYKEYPPSSRFSMNQQLKTFPSNIFEYRTPQWWNKNPSSVAFCLNKMSTLETPKFKNIRGNPFYQYLLMNKFPKTFRKKEDIKEDTITRILAAQHHQDFYSTGFGDSVSKTLTLEKYTSEEITSRFIEDLNHYTFYPTHEHEISQFKDWPSYFQDSHGSMQYNKFKPSSKFVELLQQIMTSITEEQYNNMSIFRHTSTGNPLLTLNLANDNKPQSFMLSDCLIATHQSILMNGNQPLYYDTIKELFLGNFKYANETLNLGLDKKKINLYDIQDIQNFIYPALENMYLNHIIPQIKFEPEKRKVLKF